MTEMAADKVAMTATEVPAKMATTNMTSTEMAATEMAATAMTTAVSGRTGCKRQAAAKRENCGQCKD